MNVRTINCWARAVVQDLEKRGIPTQGLLAAAGLNRAAIDGKDGWISFGAHCQLFESAPLATGDDVYGAHFGLSVDPMLAGLLAYIGFNSQCLGDALRNMAKYVDIYREGASIDINKGKDYWELLFYHRQADFAQESEFGAALVVNVITRLLRRPFRPVRLQFVHDVGSRKVTLERLHECPVERAACDGTVIAIKDTKAPVVESDTRLLSILKSHAEGLLQRPPSMRSSLVRQVESAIIGQLPSKPFAATGVADQFGISESTLRRRMSEQGVGFSDVVERVRSGLAKRYLAEGQKVKQVAYLCGYKSPSAFIAARRRWHLEDDNTEEDENLANEDES